MISHHVHHTTSLSAAGQRSGSGSYDSSISDLQERQKLLKALGGGGLWLHGRIKGASAGPGSERGEAGEPGDQIWDRDHALKDYQVGAAGLHAAMQD